MPIHRFLRSPLPTVVIGRRFVRNIKKTIDTWTTAIDACAQIVARFYAAACQTCSSLLACHSICGVGVTAAAATASVELDILRICWFGVTFFQRVTLSKTETGNRSPQLRWSIAHRPVTQARCRRSTANECLPTLVCSELLPISRWNWKATTPHPQRSRASPEFRSSSSE